MSWRILRFMVQQWEKVLTDPSYITLQISGDKIMFLDSEMRLLTVLEKASMTDWPAA